MKTMPCENCGNEVPRVWPDTELPMCGFTFNKHSLGYYAGFSDNFPSENPDEDWITICHDCSVVFMRALPGLANKVLPLRGGHPNYPKDESIHIAPCCEWAWTWDEDAPCDRCGAAGVYLANHELKWERRTCPCEKDKNL